MKNSRFKRIVVITVLMATTVTAPYALSYEDLEEIGWGYYAGVNFIGDSSVDPLDDSFDTYLMTFIDGSFLNIYRSSNYPRALSLMLSRNDWKFQPSYGLEEFGGGDGTFEVPTRIGDGAPEKWTWKVSGSDYEFSDSIAIGITDRQTVRQLYDAERLVVRVTPTMGPTQTLVFPIAGLEEALDTNTWVEASEVIASGKPKEVEALDALIQKFEEAIEVDEW